MIKQEDKDLIDLNILRVLDSEPINNTSAERKISYGVCLSDMYGLV